MPDHACDFIFSPLHCNSIVCMLSHLKKNEKIFLYIFWKDNTGKDFSALCSCWFFGGCYSDMFTLQQGRKNSLLVIEIGVQVWLFHRPLHLHGWMWALWRSGRTTLLVPGHPEFHLPSVSDAESGNLVGDFLSPAMQLFCLFMCQVQNGDFHLPHAAPSTRDYWSQLMSCWDANNSCGKPHVVTHGANAPRLSFTSSHCEA